MAKQVELEEDAVDLLYRYSTTRPSTLPILIDRIAREWYARAAREWKKKPRLIPDLRKVKEGETTGVNINSDHARIFKETAKKLDLDPIDLLSWLARTFIKGYKIKNSIEIDKKRGREKR